VKWNFLKMSEARTPPAESVVGSAEGAYIHIDTTLQIEAFKRGRHAALLKAALAPFKFRSTSTYVKHEFNRTWIRDCAYLYAKEEKSNSVADLFEAINRSFGSRMGQKNRLTRCLEIMVKFLSQRPNTLTPPQEICRVRSHLANVINNALVQWQRSVHHEFAGTKCWRGDVKAEFNNTGRVNFQLRECKPKLISCDVHGFFDRNKAAFSKIATDVESMGDGASPQLKKAAKRIRLAESDSKDLCNDKHCAEIGDCLIAVDGATIPAYAANNDSDWIPIANSLGKELINPLRGKAIGTAAPPSAKPE
jgi:hypothetical protein